MELEITRIEQDDPDFKEGPALFRVARKGKVREIVTIEKIKLRIKRAQEKRAKEMQRCDNRITGLKDLLKELEKAE